ARFVQYFDPGAKLTSTTTRTIPANNNGQMLYLNIGWGATDPVKNGYCTVTYSGSGTTVEVARYYSYNFNGGGSFFIPHGVSCTVTMVPNSGTFFQVFSFSVQRVG